MEIVKADLVIGGETITTRVYRQKDRCYSIPGPTLRMEAGKKYVLQFRNQLDYEPASEEHNVFKDPNVSNLHTHGLHISGETPGDDVTRSFEGQAGGDFVYDIPDDHMSGTYWYHAHHHGSTFLQVSAGAFGLIVIDNPVLDSSVPASVKAMQQRELVVAYLDPSVAGTGGDTLITGTLTPTWTVNGQVNGTLQAQVGTWQHWRVLLADRDARIKTLTVGGACEAVLMARDGVWRTEVPKVLPNGSINLTGASRADLGVRCSGNGNLSVGSQVVASIAVTGTENITPSPYDGNTNFTWQSTRPGYLRDLRSVTVSNFETINMGARTINGSKWDHMVPTFTLSPDGVQEFQVKGATNHPFHLHVYHVQVQAACGDFEAGEYYDVVAGNCRVRFDLSPLTAYEGRTVMHCHILEHEDQGAMGWADVLGGTPPPVFPVVVPAYDDRFPALPPPGTPPAAPSGLSATAVSSSQIDLAWTDQSNNEDFFQVDRSTDGSNFSPHGTADANVTVWLDTGLAAATTYWYRVRAVNNTGSSDPSIADSATTNPAGTPTAVQYRSITVSLLSEAKGLKRERAEVVVEDNAGNLLQGATVTGNFTGTITQNGVTAISGADGLATLQTDQTAKGSVSFEFCVTRIEPPVGSGLAPFVPAGIDTDCARL